jgi:hypothetical protein
VKPDGLNQPERLAATIVSANSETLDGLHAYLTSADVQARCCRALDVASAEVGAGCTAVVLFPDDFPRDSVVRALRNLRDRHPDVHTILVTRFPKQFQRLSDDAPRSLVIVTKPAWGWTILDAIHGRLDTDMPKRVLDS